MKLTVHCYSMMQCSAHSACREPLDVVESHVVLHHICVPKQNLLEGAFPPCLP